MMAMGYRSLKPAFLNTMYYNIMHLTQEKI